MQHITASTSMTAEARQKFRWVLATPWLQLSRTLRLRQLSVTGLPSRSTLRFYQAGLNDRLSFELTFNDYGRVIMWTGPTSSYKITIISLKFDVVTNPDLARR